jgi:hypothetical protein
LLLGQLSPARLFRTRLLQRPTKVCFCASGTNCCLTTRKCPMRVVMIAKSMALWATQFYQMIEFCRNRVSLSRGLHIYRWIGWLYNSWLYHRSEYNIIHIILLGESSFSLFKLQVLCLFAISLQPCFFHISVKSEVWESYHN